MKGLPNKRWTLSVEIYLLCMLLNSLRLLLFEWLIGFELRIDPESLRSRFEKSCSLMVYNSKYDQENLARKEN